VAVASNGDRGDLLEEILLDLRPQVAPLATPELVHLLCAIEVRNQFDDDRGPARKTIREAVENAVTILIHEGEESRP
jgi:nitrogen fixation-related uncharacterized protein